MIGTKLADRYEVLTELGRGGMGVVYRAKDPVLNRDVALKLIPPGNLTKDAEERFLREAQIVAQMDHPSIVPIYDLGRHEGAVFFVMPVLPGTHLRHMLRDGSLRLGDVLDIGMQVAEALDYSHSRGIVHRDIKPENIMTAREENGHVRVRVMDFGLALATAEDRLTKTGTLVGTVSYFSPEQVTSRHFDGRSDLYALGTVLYECLANEPPYTGEVQAILYRIVHEVPRPLRSLGADVSDELEAIVLHCLEKDPEKRPKRGAYLAEALRRYRGKLREEEFTRSVMLTSSRLVGHVPAPAAPFIGREKELAELQRRLHSAVAGECQLALIGGEPGIGKTRLVEELTTLARARKIRVLSGRFVEQDRAFAHQGFCELIQDYFRGRDPSGSAVSQPDLSDVAGDLIALFPVLSEISELRSAASSPQAGRSALAEDKTAVFELIARTLTRLGHGKPLVLVLEELHGAEQSIEALQYVARRLAPTPTLILGTYRPGDVDRRHLLSKMLESFRGDPRFLTLALGPLTPSEHRSLVEMAAGGGSVSDGLARRLYEATEGNPLFTRELVRSLLDSGGIARDPSGALQLSGAGGISSDALPETIQQAVSGRVERLPEELREALSLASVLGKTFEMRDLEALAEGRGDLDLDEAVERLVAEGLFLEGATARGDRLSFASGILRDVLYNGLARRKRKLLHKRYAAQLEKRNAGRLERVYPELLHHYTEADVPEKAVEYGLLLAKKALEAFSADEASRAARAVLDHVEGAEEAEGASAEGAEGEARLLLLRAAAMSGQTEAALREAEAALKVFEREKKSARSVAVMLAAADAAWQARRVDEARRWVERGLPAARALGEPGPLLQLLSLSATVAGFRGEHHRAATLLAEIERLTPREREREELAQGGTLVVALANSVRALEPAVTTIVEEQEVLANVFETMVTTDAQGVLMPRLAERWEVEEDGTAFAFTLREGIRFSDGEPLSAAAVKASFERARDLCRHELPPALSAIAAVEAVSERRVVFRLTSPLPIFPSLLTDVNSAVTRAGASGTVGTGPFQIVSQTPERVVLRRNPHAARTPRLEQLEFHTGMGASAIAAGLRDGRVDLARDLLPEDLDLALRDPRFRAGVVEAPKKATYLVLFNTHSSLGGQPALRRALAGVTRSHDFVWGALGRVASPATGLLPPGILGHDAGRRRALMPKEAARQLLAEAGLTPPIPVRATVHPILQDRFRKLISTLFDIWAELGVTVTVENATMAEYIAAQRNPSADLQIGRWQADYDDPDDFTYGLFQSGNGRWKSFYASTESDRLLEEARRETDSGAREGLYRRFEEFLLAEAVLIPLFHEIDYRIAAPNVRAVELSTVPPFVGYAEIAKTEAPRAPRAQVAGGLVTVPIAGDVSSLDPKSCLTAEAAECIANVFETLTRNVEGRVAPWLASEITAEAGGARFRFRLRRGVRFHDGRALTARDVRYSFERVVQSGENRGSLMTIKGANALAAGKASGLEGFRILSPSEFVIELEKPLSFFPAMISYPNAAILPEGASNLSGHWSEGTAGTGPFRVVRFEPGKLLELERNPGYWREGFPRSEGLLFRIGLSSSDIKDEFLGGRLSLASDLLPEEVEQLRADPRYAPGFRETPRLGTWFVTLNSRKGPLTDPDLRRRVYDTVDGEALVKRTLGKAAFPATGLIPPGLLGHTASRPPHPPPDARKGQTVMLTANLHPLLFGEYRALYSGIVETLEKQGIALRAVNTDMAGYLSLQIQGDTDLMIGRWNADYLDSDGFTYQVHSREGRFGAFLGAPELDRLVERGRAESDPSIRHAVYRQLEEFLAREALLIPLFHEQVYRFARPEIEGLSVGLSRPSVAYEELRVRG